MKVWLQNYVEGVLDKLIDQYTVLLTILVDDNQKKEFKEVVNVLIGHKLQIQQIINKIGS